jgi:molybdopterin-guanine dinucleotide biosynthesis protein A
MNNNPNISAFILCGGKSSRMQSEKGLVKFKNKPFIQWVIDAIKPISNNIFLVTDNPDYSFFGYTIVADVYKDKGPIGGIYSALNRSETEYNLILSCDVPNISTSVIQKYLINKMTNNHDVTFLSDDKNIYPLIAIYNKRLVPKFFDAITSDKLKLVSLLNELDCQNIKVKAEDFEFLKNINTKEELEKLEIKEKEISTK